jgi:hypothetical protein
MGAEQTRAEDRRKRDRAMLLGFGDADLDAMDEALRELEDPAAAVDARYVVKPKPAHKQRFNDRQKRERREVREKREAEGVRYIETSDGKYRPACKGTNYAGEPCGGVVLTAGKVYTLPDHDEECTATGGFCIICDNAITPAFLDAWRARARGGKKRRVGPEQFLQQMLVANLADVIRPHLKGIGLEMDIDTGEIKRIPDGGAKIYGESKDGDINMTKYDDVTAQAKLAELLLDRGFGRPRTSSDMAIAVTGPPVQIPPTAERAHEVAAVLAEANAIPTPDTDEEVDE